LRKHFTILSTKYPLSVSRQGDGDILELVAKASVLLPSVEAKIDISFIFDTDTFWSWPSTIGSVGCTVEKAYGPDIEYALLRKFVILLTNSWACLVLRKSAMLCFSVW